MANRQNQDCWTFGKAKQAFEHIVKEDTGKSLYQIQQAYHTEIERMASQIEYLTRQLSLKSQDLDINIEKNQSLTRNFERISKENYRLSKTVEAFQYQNKISNSYETRKYLENVKDLENALKEEQAQSKKLKEMFQTLANLGIPVSDIHFRQKMTTGHSNKSIRRKTKMKSMFVPKIPLELVNSYSSDD